LRTFGAGLSDARHSLDALVPFGQCLRRAIGMRARRPRSGTAVEPREGRFHATSSLIPRHPRFGCSPSRTTSSRARRRRNEHARRAITRRDSSSCQPRAHEKLSARERA
jgi:hypothetical protein